MFQRLLRNTWAIDVYKNLPGVDNAFAKKYPSQDEWQQLAKYEAVISPIQKCAISIKLMILPPIPGPFWKYILPDMKLKECVCPMQWCCP